MNKIQKLDNIGVCVVSLDEFEKTFTNVFELQYKDFDFEDTDWKRPDLFIDHVYEYQRMIGEGSEMTHFCTAGWYNHEDSAHAAILFLQGNMFWQDYIATMYDLFSLCINLGIIPVMPNGMPYDHYILDYGE